MEIINIDAMQYMKDLKEDSFDMVILDPDYNDWEELLDKGIIEQSMKVLKPTGNMLAFTKQPFDHKLRCRLDKWFRREIVWTFDNGGAWTSNRMPLVSAQKIYWCVKSKQFFFNPRTGVDYSDNTRNFKRTNKVFGGYKEEGRNFEKSKDGVWIRDHLHYNKPHTKEIPAKPKELVQILIRCFCEDGGLILDPFAGSGVIEEVACEQDKDIIGLEINSNRCDDIINRLIKN